MESLEGTGFLPKAQIALCWPPSWRGCSGDLFGILGQHRNPFSTNWCDSSFCSVPKCHCGEFAKQNLYNIHSINKMKMFILWVIFEYSPTTHSNSIKYGCWHDCKSASFLKDPIEICMNSWSQEAHTQRCISHRTNELTLTCRQSTAELLILKHDIPYNIYEGNQICSFVVSSAFFVLYK